MQFPDDFLTGLSLLYPDNVDSALQALKNPHHPAIRVNTLKTETESIKKIFTDANIEFQTVPWYKDAFTTPQSTASILGNLEAYNKGEFYIQNLSSILVSLILDPQPGEKILDIAAAPGSKTSHIAALMKNTGTIVANDISRDRIFKLQHNLARLGVSNTEFSNMPGEKIWQKYPESFDRVLVDAPCSMEGRFILTDTESYADWSLKKVKHLSKEQRWLLRSAVSATKVNGVILYSTCTMAPEENEEVIDWILKKEQGTVELLDIQYQNVPMVPGLVQWQEKKYDHTLEKTKRILPSSEMEGFFIAKLRKIASNI